MTDRPIIFSAPMVRALLDGRKTQTRRITKRQDSIHVDGKGGWLYPGLLPYAPGDRLYVREAHYLTDDGECEYAVFAADQADVDEHLANMQAIMASHPSIDWSKHLRLRPSIHMPRWASRLTLTVTDVRVHRLQDISEADAIAEGATSRAGCYGFLSRDSGWSMDWSMVGKLSPYATGATRAAQAPLRESDISLGDPQMAFANYWNTLHGPDAWDANPWVVAISFTVQHGNIDQIGGAA